MDHLRGELTNVWKTIRGYGLILIDIYNFEFRHTQGGGNLAQKKQRKQEKPVEKVKPRKKETAPKKTAKKPAENVVFIGRKPVMNYVIACLTFFNNNETAVTVKARGRAISRAVDTIELLRRAFVKDLGIKNIKIATEEMTREDGQKSNVSTIEITVSK
jgi:DNA-binding protein